MHGVLDRLVSKLDLLVYLFLWSKIRDVNLTSDELLCICAALQYFFNVYVDSTCLESDSLIFDKLFYCLHWFCK